jgi:hypothetical protein
MMSVLESMLPRWVLRPRHGGENMLAGDGLLKSNADGPSALPQIAYKQAPASGILIGQTGVGLSADSFSEGGRPRLR